MVKENRIDTHAHVFAASCAIAPGARYRPAGEAPLAEWLALQDAAGVSHGVQAVLHAAKTAMKSAAAIVA
jgi:predicted TIM-barrel fold metal-dependent hydrolase